MRLTVLGWFLAVALFAVSQPAAVSEVHPNLLSNGMMDDFTSEVATDWTAYHVNDGGRLVFQSDPVNFDIAPFAQGIFGIDSPLLSDSLYVAAGLYRQVKVTPGKLYLYVGYQDIYNSAYSAAGYRYIHSFGIGVAGGTDPGTPDESGTIGGASWLDAGQVFRNADKGGAPTAGGFHRCMSAFTAESDTITLWTGVTVQTAGAVDASPTNFDIDSNYLFEFDNPVNTTGSLINPGFESSIALDDGGGGENPDTIPDGWTPCGGGIGYLQHIWTDPSAGRSGNYGVRMWNRYGVCSYGLMQRVSTKPGTLITFGCYAQASGYCTASVGIDPTGGMDINSPTVQWSSTQEVGWSLISVSASAEGPTAVLFLRNHSLPDTGQSHCVSFDDATASWTDGATDITPPSAVIVTDGGAYTASSSELSASWTAAVDPESGVSSYEWGIGTAPGEVEVTGWISAGNATAATVTGLTLVRGRKYYISVRAVNGTGLTGPTSSSDGIWCAQIPSTIGEAKAWPDDTPVVLTDKLITASFANDYWLSEPDRSSGIRVRGVSTTQSGGLTTVGGLLGLVDGERCLVAAGKAVGL